MDIEKNALSYLKKLEESGQVLTEKEKTIAQLFYAKGVGDACDENVQLFEKSEKLLRENYHLQGELAKKG
jgi:hypothetical protein